MNFDPIDLKIWAFKVGKKSFFELWSEISDDFDCHLWNIFAMKTLNFEFYVLKNWVEGLERKFLKKNTWFSLIKKMLSRSRFEIE